MDMSSYGWNGSSYVRWNDFNRENKKRVLIIVSIIVLALLALGIYWAKFYHKVSYYEDVVFHYEWPEGINKISKSEAKKRNVSYMLEKDGALSAHWTKVSAVDGKLQMNKFNTFNTFNKVFLDPVISIGDKHSSRLTARLNDVCCWEFVADENNKYVVQQKAYDDTGCLVYDFSYTRHLNNTYNGLYTSPVGIPIRSSQHGAVIVKITLDERGYRSFVEFFDAWGNRSCDKNRVYAYKFEYDKDGLLRRKGAVNEKGDYVYDTQFVSSVKNQYENGRLISRTYLNPEGLPTKNKQGFMVEKITYDKYGRLSSLEYEGEDGTPATILNFDDMCHRIEYEYDENGYLIKYLCKDESGNVVGERGYGISAEGNTCECNASNTMSVKPFYNEQNRLASLWGCRNDSLVADENGVAGVVFEYDDRDNLVKKSYLNVDKKPASIDGNVYSIEYQYDDFNNCTRMIYKDSVGEPVKNMLQIAYAFDSYGNVTSVECFSNDGKKPVNGTGGWQKCEYVYDGNRFLQEVVYYDVSGYVIYSPKKKYAIERLMNDGNGRVLSRYYLDDNRVRMNADGYSWDTLIYEGNNLVREFAYDLKSNPVFRTEYKYDPCQRLIEESFFDAKGNPYVKNGYSKKQIEYQRGGKTITSYLAADGKVLRKDSVSTEQEVFKTSVMDNQVKYKTVKTHDWKYEGEMKNGEPYGDGRFTWLSTGFFIEGSFKGWNTMINSWNCNEAYWNEKHD